MTIYELTNNNTEVIEALYKNRLALEADLSRETVLHDMDASAFRCVQKALKALVSGCQPEEDYLKWKEAFLSAEYEKLGDTKLLCCSYLFAGIGQYEEVMPACQYESFKCWIDSCGSAFLGSSHEATEDEAKLYIALHAADGIKLTADELMEIVGAADEEPVERPKYMILDVKNGVSGGGMACGPIDGIVVSEVALQDEDGAIFFVSLAEVMGTANIYMTNHSTIEGQLAQEDDEDFWDELGTSTYTCGEYSEILEMTDVELYDVFRYLIYMVRCAQGEEERFAKATIGKRFGEFEIPVSDVEQDYLDELAYDE